MMMVPVLPLLVVLAATAAALASVSSTWDVSSSSYVTASSSTQEAVDLLVALNVTEGTPGVRVVKGAAPGLAAFRLRAAYAQVRVPSPASVTQVLGASKGFSLLFVYRQHRKSLGTLLSVHSPGKVSPWLQLSSNLRTGRLQLHYRLQGDPKMHAVAWGLPQPPHSRGWTRVALSAVPAEGRLRLRLDCQSPLEEQLPAKGRLDIPGDALVYFRQEPGFKKKFLGTVQVAKILPYSETVEDWNCDGPSVAVV